MERVAEAEGERPGKLPAGADRRRRGWWSTEEVSGCVWVAVESPEKLLRGGAARRGAVAEQLGVELRLLFCCSWVEG